MNFNKINQISTLSDAERQIIGIVSQYLKAMGDDIGIDVILSKIEEYQGSVIEEIKGVFLDLPQISDEKWQELVAKQKPADVAEAKKIITESESPKVIDITPQPKQHYAGREVKECVCGTDFVTSDPDQDFCPECRDLYPGDSESLFDRSTRSL